MSILIDATAEEEWSPTIKQFEKQPVGNAQVRFVQGELFWIIFSWKTTYRNKAQN